MTTGSSPSKRPISLSSKAAFLLTLLSGVAILFPSSIFQNTFAQGDHGRDLYVFSMTANGAAPYRDFWWPYGPLMLYFYAFFMKIHSSIHTVLIAESFLKLSCGLAFFGIMRQLTTPLWSHLCALFFMSFYPFFFHTYTYTGGVLFVLLTILMLSKYIFTVRSFYAYLGLPFILALCLIKPNIGIGLWIGYILCMVLADKTCGVPLKNRKLFYALCLSVPALTFLVYFLMTVGLPQEIINQCFTYSRSGGRQVSIELLGIPGRIFDIISGFALKQWPNALLVGLGILTGIGFISLYTKLDPQTKKPLTVMLGSLGLLVLLLLQEFFVSGVPYRGLWAIPVLLLVIFITLGQLLKLLPSAGRLAVIFLLTVTTVAFANRNFQALKNYEREAQFLKHPRGGIFIGNEPQWFDTVLRTTAFLEGALAKDELFLALPYEPLYYYLLDRPSPTYHYCFFDFMELTAQQELQMIADLEQKKVNWLIFSNRIITAEPGLGTFGQSNSTRLAEYLNANFELVGELGPWGPEPNWTTNHGIRIMKRKPGG